MKAPILFIGQAPPQRLDTQPFGRTHLYKWLANIGIERQFAVDTFAFTALVTEFPGLKGRSHQVPSDEAILQNIPRLVQLIRDIKPQVIVPVGAHSARRILCMPEAKLQDMIGKRFYMRPFAETSLPVLPIIPLPHPSGASAWIHQGDNPERLRAALTLLRQEFEML